MSVFLPDEETADKTYKNDVPSRDAPEEEHFAVIWDCITHLPITDTYPAPVLKLNVKMELAEADASAKGLKELISSR